MDDLLSNDAGSMIPEDRSPARCGQPETGTVDGDQSVPRSVFSIPWPHYTRTQSQHNRVLLDVECSEIPDEGRMPNATHTGARRTPPVYSRRSVPDLRSP